MVDLKDLPALTSAQIAETEAAIQWGKRVSRRGQVWFRRLAGQLQQYPDQTLVSINVETGEYYTAPPGWDDFDVLERNRPAGDHSKYWTCRLKEGSDGQKYPGGVYSVANTQADAHSSNQ